MTVYLGTEGCIELERTAGSAVREIINPGDVSIEKRRFSTNGDILGVFISGDQIEIETVDKSDLVLIAGHNFPDWRGFAYVDALGGMRLYDSYEKALRGERLEAIELVEPTEAQEVFIRTRNDSFSPLARVRSFEFTTTRDTVDTTHLGQEFVNRYEAGLISGQGVIECFWEHKFTRCEDNPEFFELSNAEFPFYLAQLCIRLKEGADFFGRFFIYRGEEDEASVWYEAECIVTNVSTSLEPTQVITSTINFVTTGQFRLLTGTPPYYLLEESGDSFILLENGDRILLNASE